MLGISNYLFESLITKLIYLVNIDVFIANNAPALTSKISLLSNRQVQGLRL